MVGPEFAIKGAQRGLDRLKIEDNPGVAAARVGGHAGAPILVLRLDAPGQGYYLVPWQDQRGIVLIVQVDAESGLMASVAAPSVPLPRLAMSPEEARLASFDRLGVRVTGEPRLVWQACRETASPFQPLYEVPTETGNVFIGMDGSVHGSLTPFMKGG
ncbi:hypothetical protein [Nitrosospira briensis]|uniref:hypothetical protein n=1 Tax=Nitrosospira briensis TaxID=35799 RepID=UPI00046AF1D5|nr:hypothetical protein [Nitrosospira briensis]